MKIKRHESDYLDVLHAEEKGKAIVVAVIAFGILLVGTYSLEFNALIIISLVAVAMAVILYRIFTANEQYILDCKANILIVKTPTVLGTKTHRIPLNVVRQIYLRTEPGDEVETKYKVSLERYSTKKRMHLPIAVFTFTPKEQELLGKSFAQMLNIPIRYESK